jgi:hypothetical protein
MLVLSEKRSLHYAGRSVAHCRRVTLPVPDNPLGAGFAPLKIFAPALRFVLYSAQIIVKLCFPDGDNSVISASFYED